MSGQRSKVDKKSYTLDMNLFAPLSTVIVWERRIGGGGFTCGRTGGTGGGREEDKYGLMVLLVSLMLPTRLSLAMAWQPVANGVGGVVGRTVVGREGAGAGQGTGGGKAPELERLEHPTETRAIGRRMSIGPAVKTLPWKFAAKFV
eukprot:1084198-Ditylum_brightwellii.AAC.1